jgi:hypothetical protein
MLGLYWIAHLASRKFVEGTLTDCWGFAAVPFMVRAWADWGPLSHRSIYASIPFHALLSSVAPEALTSDPRDRIYAFLGLNRDPRILLEPNYAVGLTQTLIETTIAIIRGTNSLDILNFVRRKPCYGYD